MATGDDSNITVISADDVNIRIRVDGYPDDQHYDTGNASRIPAEGLCAFDFVNDAGTLSEIHAGHAVTKRVRGPWSKRALAFAIARLTFVGPDSGKLTMRGNQAFLRG